MKPHDAGWLVARLVGWLLVVNPDVANLETKAGSPSQTLYPSKLVELDEPRPLFQHP